MRWRTLEPITKPASEPEVVFVVGAASRHGNDVVDLQQPKHIPLWTLAISATVLGQLSYSLPDHL